MKKRTLKSSLWLMNLLFKDLIHSGDHKSATSKTAFWLVKNCKTAEHVEGYCHLAWVQLVEKYAPKLAPLLLHLKKQFRNSRIKKAIDHPNAWITKLEELWSKMDEIGLTATMKDDDFMLHAMGTWPKQYEATLIHLEHCFYKSGSDNLTIEVICQKLNKRCKQM